jgi:hypothetical protein
MLTPTYRLSLFVKVNELEYDKTEDFSQEHGTSLEEWMVEVSWLIIVRTDGFHFVSPSVDKVHSLNVRN